MRDENEYGIDPNAAKLIEGGVSLDAAPQPMNSPDLVRKEAPKANPNQLSGRRKRAPHAVVRFDAIVELRALETLKASLAVHHEILDDPQLILDMAEGSTSIFEAMDRLVGADAADDALIVGLKHAKDTISVRLHRLEERRQSRRTILEQAMMLLECKTLERPLATLTLSDRPATLTIEEEAQIPARFFQLKPILDRRLVREALEAGEEVAGARLSNGTVSLTLRRR
ncbi:MAG: siphovirus Gp157 family protein [Hyphomonadaceae bacterium]